MAGIAASNAKLTEITNTMNLKFESVDLKFAALEAVQKAQKEEQIAQRQEMDGGAQTKIK